MKPKGFLKKAVIGATLVSPILIGGIISFASTPSFVGLTGIASAAAVGLGTAVGTFGLAVPALLAGLGLGGTLAMLTRNPRHNGTQAFAPFMTKLVGTATAIGAAAAVYGGIKGYQLSQEKLENKDIKTLFNAATRSAPETKETLVLTPQLIATAYKKG